MLCVIICRAERHVGRHVPNVDDAAANADVDDAAANADVDDDTDDVADGWPTRS